MEVDDHNVMIDIPNTVLFGLVPAGQWKYTTPLGNISNVYTSTSYKIGRLLAGLFICLIALGMFGESFLGALVTLTLGALMIASGLITVFSYENNGNSISIFLPFLKHTMLKIFRMRLFLTLINIMMIVMVQRPHSSLMISRFNQLNKLWMLLKHNNS